MEEVAAYWLAVLGGSTRPTAYNVKDIFGSVGADAIVDNDRIELLPSEHKGKGYH